MSRRHAPGMAATRLAAWFAGLWAGLLWGIGLIGAPSGFAAALPETAGRVAGRMFMQEAYVSLLLAVVMFLMLRRQARAAAASGSGSVLSANLLLVFGALFCTVAGHFGLQPMLAAARAGHGTLSFGTLHGVSAGLYGLKAILVSVLAWRLTRSPDEIRG